METLLGLVVFGALFFLMMRFGCGAHMAHGPAKEGGGVESAHGGCCGAGHEAHAAPGEIGQGAQPAQDAGRDPVCGMHVEAEHGYSTSHEGRRYRFCSKGCLDRFEADPAQYGVRARGTAPG